MESAQRLNTARGVKTVGSNKNRQQQNLILLVSHEVCWWFFLSGLQMLTLDYPLLNRIVPKRIHLLFKRGDGMMLRHINIMC